MKKKKIVEIRKMEAQALEKMATDLKKEIAIVQLKKATENSKDTNVISKNKRQLARVLTIKRERELTSVTNL